MPPAPIPSPQRILILSTSPTSGVLPFLTSLTGSAPIPHVQPELHTDPPSPNSTPNPPDPPNKPSPPTHPKCPPPPPTTAQKETTAGLSHTLYLSNAYYKASIPIWIDETADPGAWAHDFSSADAKDVVRAVGAWVVVFRLPSDEGGGSGSGSGMRCRQDVGELLAAVRTVIGAAYKRDGDGDEHENGDGEEGEWDGVCLAIGWPADSDPHNGSRTIISKQSGPQDLDLDLNTQKKALDTESEREEWEDLCFEHGFEYVDCSVKGGRNELGELQGLERVREALEANEWEGGALDGDVEGVEAEFLWNDEGEDGFGAFAGGEMMDEALLRDEKNMERGTQSLKAGAEYDFDADGDADEDAANGDGGAQQVEELERMMGRMIAVKEMTAHLPKEQRKKAATRAVNDIMKTI